MIARRQQVDGLEGALRGGGATNQCIIISVARRAAPDRTHSIIRGQIHYGKIIMATMRNVVCYHMQISQLNIKYVEGQQLIITCTSFGKEVCGGG